MNTTVNCAHAPSVTPSDAGVAGEGVLLAFIITAGIAILLSAYILFGELRTSITTHGVLPRTISRKLLNSFSDQQIVEGIGIQALGLAKINSMVPYHFFIVWLLALLSTATHLATLLALFEDYKRDWVLRWLRQFFMFVNFVLNIVCGVVVLETNLKHLTPTLPVVCTWAADHSKSKPNQSTTALSIVGTIAVIAACGIVFALATWYLHMRRQRWGKIVRVASLLVLAAVAVGAAVRVIMVSQAFGTPSVALADSGERDWSFGQLLGMLMLALPFISALEILRGELDVPKTMSSQSDEDRQPLHGDAELKPVPDRYSYQPNPFQGRLFKAR